MERQTGVLLPSNNRLGLRTWVTDHGLSIDYTITDVSREKPSPIRRNSLTLGFKTGLETGRQEREVEAV